MTKSQRGVTAFLGVTALAIVWEVWSAVDGNPDTWPWTELIVAYIPWEVTAFFTGGLVLWLPFHFGIRYYRKHRATSSETRAGLSDQS